jgi:hypothetical protein
MIVQVYKEAFKARATSFNVPTLPTALKVLINVYHTLFFVIPALQCENDNKKSKLKYGVIVIVTQVAKNHLSFATAFFRYF